MQAFKLPYEANILLAYAVFEFLYITLID